VLPYHKLVDGASASSKAIGTTGRGIGPAYEDKIARRGVRVLDLRHPERLRDVVEKGAEHARGSLCAQRLRASRSDVRRVLALLGRLSERLLPLADDVRLTVHRAVQGGRRGAARGAQGSLLDIDHGTYRS
jgi:adenylosuccinate synthase